MSYQKLERHRKTWREKKLLRAIYSRWYRKMLEHASGRGTIVEIGSGSGNLKEFYPDLIASDYIFCPWLDVNLDAHALPFGSQCLGAIVALDVLHHLADPVSFLKEAERVLAPGGRLVMVEPFISPWSWPVYKFFHEEDVDFSFDPLEPKSHAAKKDPFQGNMAIATNLFFRKPGGLQKHVPGLEVIERQLSDFLLYPMSGGFDHPSLCPEFLAPFLLLLEKIAGPAKRFLAYRALIVMERKAVS
jgi:SAM-dependent methyltransferase